MRRFFNRFRRPLVSVIGRHLDPYHISQLKEEQ